MPSELTNLRYKSVMNAVMKEFTSVDIDNNPEEIIDFLEVKYPNPNTRRVALSAMSQFQMNTDSFKVYKKALDDIRDEATSYANNQTMPQVKKENFIDWPDVVKTLKKVRKAFLKGNESLENLLLVSLYVLQKPLRLDYAGMLLNKIDNTKNYAILKGPKKSFFYFNDYKTSQTYGTVIIPINPTLLKLLKEYVKERSIINVSREMLSKKIIELFKKYSGKAMSVSMLRHSYITDFLKSNPSEEEKERVSKLMLHSKYIQSFYNVPS